MGLDMSKADFLVVVDELWTSKYSEYGVTIQKVYPLLYNCMRVLL